MDKEKVSDLQRTVLEEKGWKRVSLGYIGYYQRKYGYKSHKSLILLQEWSKWTVGEKEKRKPSCCQELK